MVAEHRELPARLRAPLRQLLTFAGTSLWIAPTAAGAVAVVLAVGLLRSDPSVAWLPVPLDDAAAARASLTTVASATVVAISLMGTGTIVALQLAAGQYSPRLLRGVLNNGRIRWSLAGFVGVVVYELVVLIRTTGEDIPAAAIALGLVLGIVAVGLLVLFIHEIAARVRLETILDRVTSDTLAAVESTHPPEDDEEVDTSVPDRATALTARRSGYLQAVSLDALARAAASHRVHLRVRPRVGAFLVAGTAMGWVWSVDAELDVDEEAHDDLARAVDRSLALGVDRTIEGDPAYGIRHLVDVGLRAISPAINDPTTTIQCIHHASSILVALASRRLHDGVATRDGCHAILTRPSLADHLDLAQSQLLQYGGHDTRIVETLAEQLRDVAEATDVDHALIRDHLERLRTDATQRSHRPHQDEVLQTAFARVEDVLGGRADEEEPTAG